MPDVTRRYFVLDATPRDSERVPVLIQPNVEFRYRIEGFNEPTILTEFFVQEDFAFFDILSIQCGRMEYVDRPINACTFREMWTDDGKRREPHARQSWPVMKPLQDIQFAIVNRYKEPKMFKAYFNALRLVWGDS